jgi:hypothetical protein
MDEGGSVDELPPSLFEEAPWRGLGGSSFIGDLGRYVKKVSMEASFQPRVTWYWGGGLYTGDFDR